MAGIDAPRARLSWMGLLAALAVVSAGVSRADTWAAPQDAAYYSENGRYEFLVQLRDPKQVINRSTGTLRRKGAGSEQVWAQPLVNRVCPVSAMVTDSGKYVVTFDEHHSVGRNPVVIYGDGGRLIANLSLTDLKLENHPNITRSVSSYWWNEWAIIVFGPHAGNGKESWRGSLADSLFIRLYWGEVIAIDLASGSVRDGAWWGKRAADDARAMKQATQDYLDATWLRLAREYLRKENFEPDPTDKGVKGVLLAGQLRLREALPLLREVADTDRFQHWAAPVLKGGAGGSNVRDVAKAAIKEIE